jgi:hypothetical protein
VATPADISRHPVLAGLMDDLCQPGKVLTLESRPLVEKPIRRTETQPEYMAKQIHYLSRHDLSHWLDVQHVRSTSLAPCNSR